MQRKTIGTISALALLLAAAAATAGEVYEWKDANGVTHYTQTPPKTGDYKEHDERDVAPEATSARTGTSATPAPKTASATAGAGAESAQCATARKNLELLQGEVAVQQDTDGDGKPDKTLDDADRANQLELARATLKAGNCPA